MKINRQQVYDKFDGHCAYCGDPIEYKDMQVDHIVPKRRGDTESFCNRIGTTKGIDNISNYNPACRKCNIHKSTYTIEQFRDELQEQLGRANRYDRNYINAKKWGQVVETPKPIVFYFERHKHAE